MAPSTLLSVAHWPRRTIALVGAIALIGSLVVFAFTLDTNALSRALRAMTADPVGLIVAMSAFAFAFVLRAIAWSLVLPQLSLSHALAGIHLALGANHVLSLIHI